VADDGRADELRRRRPPDSHRSSVEHPFGVGKTGGAVRGLELATNTLVDFLGVGVSPWGIATNGTYAYVANSLSNTVSVIALCPS
jgi:DNA-binding beta-propeller fold protein YncE